MGTVLVDMNRARETEGMFALDIWIYFRITG
ncbi:MAG: hypothetical protein PWR27_500, partial [Petroclostridium sp.]|nr:hypothetical protein [Petroclostridium sp.]